VCLYHLYGNVVHHFPSSSLSFLPSFLLSRPDGQSDYAALLTLLLLRSALPFIKQDRRSDQAQGNDSHTVPSAVLSHLCGLLDSAHGAEPTVLQLAQDIVVEGVVVFFPDATARKEYVLSMISSVLSDNQPRSWWLKFEALCQYFSKADVNSLLNLPSTVEEVSGRGAWEERSAVHVQYSSHCTYNPSAHLTITVPLHVFLSHFIS